MKLLIKKSMKNVAITKNVFCVRMRKDLLLELKDVK